MKPVSLNKFRKAKARADKKARANENAITFGRSTSQKNALELERERAMSKLDGHEIRDDDD